MKHDGFQINCLTYPPKYHISKNSIKLFYLHLILISFILIVLSIFYQLKGQFSKEMVFPKLHMAVHGQAFHSRNQIMLYNLYEAQF